MKTPLVIASIAALSISAASADADAFTALDLDQSGGVSLEEARVAVPDLSEEEFGAFDADASGELSADEFKTWATSKTDGADDQEDQ